ncbi:MAG: DUF4372 domain-containing protein [Bacteroidales bacterium]|nr:DUF4372 domain-containing protein [Bacteroidales bacterium]
MSLQLEIHCVNKKQPAIRNVTLFSQRIRLIPRGIFNSPVRKYKSDHLVKGINSWTPLISILYTVLYSFGLLFNTLTRHNILQYFVKR